MVKVYAPNKQYNGISASVNFVNGVGETEDKNLIAWFKSKGYKVTDEITKSSEKVTKEPEKVTENEEKEPVKKRNARKKE